VAFGDAFGDGLCCSFGTGANSVDFDGVNYPSPTGGAYGSGETITVGTCPPPPPCLGVDMTLDITLDNFPTETSWSITENGVPFASGGGYTTAGQAVSETFCADPAACYEVTMNDAFGDGICCSFGAGNYSITFDGVTTASPTGGAFGASETVQVGACSNKTSSIGSTALQNVRMEAYPNPFSNTATFKFILNETEEVSLEVYDIKGIRVGVLFNGIAEGGQSIVKTLDGTDLDNGLYIYRLIGAQGTFHTGKIVLNK
jgi:hypothetical protein